MKTPYLYALLTLLFFVGRPGELRADVSSFAIFEVANYHQTNSMQPLSADVPNAYYLGAELGTATNFSGDTNEVLLTNSFFFTPDDTQYYMSSSDGMNFFYNSPFFTNQADLDTVYMPGDYEFDINDGADSGDLLIPSNTLYSADIPYFTGDTWTNMQQLDTSQPFTLTWNNFTPNPGANSSFIFVRVFDQTGFSPYSTNYITPGVLSASIPAVTLSPGTTYTIQLFFSDRTNEVDSGFSSDATSVSGFDNLTYTTLITLPLPSLSITQVDTNVVVSWPASATNFVLQSTTQIPPTDGWMTITDPPTVLNRTNLFTNSIAGSAKFFRLADIAPIFDAALPTRGFGYTKRGTIVHVLPE